MMNKASADQQITSFQSLDSGSDGKAASKKRDQEYFKKVSERERKQVRLKKYFSMSCQLSEISINQTD